MGIDIESSDWVNEEISVLDYITKASSNDICPLEANFSAHDDSDMNSDHSKVDVYIIPIELTNDTTCSYPNNDVNVVYDFYAPLLSSTYQ